MSNLDQQQLPESAFAEGTGLLHSLGRTVMITLFELPTLGVLCFAGGVVFVATHLRWVSLASDPETADWSSFSLVAQILAAQEVATKSLAALLYFLLLRSWNFVQFVPR